MRKWKHCLALALALALLGAHSQAEQTLTSENGDATAGVAIIYDLHESYTVTIPSGDGTVYLTRDNMSIGNLTMNNLRLLSGSTLSVSVDSGNNFKLVKDEQHELPYMMRVMRGGNETVFYSNYDAGRTPVISVSAGSRTTSASCSIRLELTGGMPEATGDYTDTLTFTVNLQDA